MTYLSWCNHRFYDISSLGLLILIFLEICVENIAGPFFYKSEQAPGYCLSIWSMIVANLAEISLIISYLY
jgi:hypothetical protein